MDSRLAVSCGERAGWGDHKSESAERKAEGKEVRKEESGERESLLELKAV